MTISCKYPEPYRSEPKFFCRMMHSGVCAYKAPVKRSKKAVKEGKISQHDDQVKQVFTVSMKTVNERDSGEYWCGAETAGSEHGYKVYITRIIVAVAGECVGAKVEKYGCKRELTLLYLIFNSI